MPGPTLATEAAPTLEGPFGSLLAAGRMRLGRDPSPTVAESACSACETAPIVGRCACSFCSMSATRSESGAGISSTTVESGVGRRVACWYMSAIGSLIEFAKLADQAVQDSASKESIFKVQRGEQILNLPLKKAGPKKGPPVPGKRPGK